MKELLERLVTLLEETVAWHREQKTDELELKNRDLSLRERVFKRENSDSEYDEQKAHFVKERLAADLREGYFAGKKTKAELREAENDKAKEYYAGFEKDTPDEKEGVCSSEIFSDTEQEPEYVSIPEDAELFTNEKMETQDEKKPEFIPDPVFTPWSLSKYKSVKHTNGERERYYLKIEDPPEDIIKSNESATRKYRASVKKQLDYWVGEKRLTGYKTGARTHTLENTLMNILVAREDLAGSDDNVSLPEKEDGGYIIVGPEGAAFAEHIKTKDIEEHIKQTVANKNQPESELQPASFKEKELLVGDKTKDSSVITEKDIGKTEDELKEDKDIELILAGKATTFVASAEIDQKSGGCYG